MSSTVSPSSLCESTRIRAKAARRRRRTRRFYRPLNICCNRHSLKCKGTLTRCLGINSSRISPTTVGTCLNHRLSLATHPMIQQGNTTKAIITNRATILTEALHRLEVLNGAPSISHPLLKPTTDLNMDLLHLATDHRVSLLLVSLQSTLVIVLRSSGTVLWAVFLRTASVSSTRARWVSAATGRLLLRCGHHERTTTMCTDLRNAAVVTLQTCLSFGGMRPAPAMIQL